MKGKQYVCIGAVIALGIQIVVGNGLNIASAINLRDAIGLFSFAALAILAETLAIGFSAGSKGTVRTSIAFLPLLACPLLFSTSSCVAVAFVAGSVTQIAVRRNKAWFAAFNTSQGVIAIYAAASAYNFVLDTLAADSSVIAFIVLAIVFFAVNILIVGTVSALRQGERIWKVILKFFGTSGGNVFYGLLASPVSVFVALLYERLWVGGVMLTILPLLLIRHTYLDKVRLQQANRDLLRVLIKTIETRDPYTSGHSLRVSGIARAIAEDLGLPRRKVEQIETAGLLHDIGKIDMVYAAIIKKPSGLTEDERKVIQTHPVKGAELLKTLTSFDEEVIKGVRHHHERFDGTGYPDRLAGAAIPISARIIMLCDSIDAMLSDRTYRAALSLDQVRDEILRCAGSQFDPGIVEAIVRLGTLEKAAAAVRAEAPSSPLATLAVVR